MNTCRKIELIQSVYAPVRKKTYKLTKVTTNIFDWRTKEWSQDIAFAVEIVEDKWYKPYGTLEDAENAFKFLIGRKMVCSR